MLDFVFNHAAIIGTLFFFTFFVVMIVWVYRPGAKKNYQKKADIVFAGDEK